MSDWRSARHDYFTSHTIASPFLKTSKSASALGFRSSENPNHVGPR
jgi:hypothetical protein